MARREIDIRLIVRVAPNVVTDGRIHVLSRRIEIFLVAFDLVDKGCFGDRNPNIILLTPLAGRRWWRVRFERVDMTNCALPKLAVRGARATTQFTQLFLRNVDTRMYAKQVRAKSRLARSHQLNEWMFSF